MKNKLYTKSYIIKRLIEEGFNVQKLDITFSPEDSRYWILNINPKYQNILLTCFLDKINKDFYFRLYAGDANIKVRTLSAKVLIDSIRNIIKDNE
jgi:hypothetical protein